MAKKTQPKSRTAKPRTAKSRAGKSSGSKITIAYSGAKIIGSDPFKSIKKIS